MKSLWKVQRNALKQDKPEQSTTTTVYLTPIQKLLAEEEARAQANKNGEERYLEEERKKYEEERKANAEAFQRKLAADKLEMERNAAAEKIEKEKKIAAEKAAHEERVEQERAEQESLRTVYEYEVARRQMEEMIEKQEREQEQEQQQHVSQKPLEIMVKNNFNVRVQPLNQFDLNMNSNFNQVVEQEREQSMLPDYKDRQLSPRKRQDIQQQQQQQKKQQRQRQ